jgi:hypothetical protein
MGFRWRGDSMANEQLEEIKEFERARSALVLERQQQAKAIVSTPSEGTARAFTRIQEGIEAIDRAIEELEGAELEEELEEEEPDADS